MQVLVFNAGSSSLKFGIFSVGTETREVFKGSYERFRAEVVNTASAMAKPTSAAQPSLAVPGKP